MLDFQAVLSGLECYVWEVEKWKKNRVYYKKGGWGKLVNDEKRVG